MKSDRKKKANLLLRIALLAFSCYMLVVLAQLRMEIAERNRRLDKLKASVAYQQQMNEDMQDKREHYESYLEQQAREQGRGQKMPGKLAEAEENIAVATAEYQEAEAEQQTGTEALDNGGQDGEFPGREPFFQPDRQPGHGKQS